MNPPPHHHHHPSLAQLLLGWCVLVSDTGVGQVCVVSGVHVEARAWITGQVRETPTRCARCLARLARVARPVGMGSRECMVRDVLLTRYLL